MAEITAALVKELRERTGQGMMECKKVLVAVGGDIEKAIDEMRASGAIKAAKKAGNIAAEGSIAIEVAANNRSAVIIEVNSQTDFLALQEDFKKFVADSLAYAVSNNLTSVEPLIAARESDREQLVAKCGENVNIRRLQKVEADVLASYLHGHRIGVIVALQGGTIELAKDIAMHVAANNPQFVSPESVTTDVIAKEREIFLSLNADKVAQKPAEILEKMIDGNKNKFFALNCLTEQPFVKDPEIKVGKLAEKAGAKILSFVRFEVGEGIAKAESDFAAEVAAQVASSKK